MQFTYSFATIEQAAIQCWNIGQNHKVWAFYGDMGSGKTTLIHALCDTLQVTSTISSPTYAIINEYFSPMVGTIYHMDWYRLNSTEEAMQAGVEDALYSGHLCLVEWPGKAPELLSTDALAIHITVTSSDTRTLLLQQATPAQQPAATLPLNLPKSS